MVLSLRKVSVSEMWHGCFFRPGITEHMTAFMDLLFTSRAQASIGSGRTLGLKPTASDCMLRQIIFMVAAADPLHDVRCRIQIVASASWQRGGN